MVQIAPITGDSERFGIAGLTRVVEATYGSPADGGHGWHLHIHALVFACSSLQAGLIDQIPHELVGDRVDRPWLGRNVFAARVHERWSAGLQKAGLMLPGAVGVDIRQVSDDGSDYVGRYLSKATYDAATKIGMEAGGGVLTKESTVARNRTPFEILAGLAESLDARNFGIRTPRRWSVKPVGDGDWAVLDLETGEVTAVTPPGEWRIWHEWEQGSKGRRQVLWSRRRAEPASEREELWNALLDRRGSTAEESDEVLAARDCGGEVLGEISRADWYRVMAWRPALIVTSLEAAEHGGAEAVSETLQLVGVAFVRRPPPREP